MPRFTLDATELEVVKEQESPGFTKYRLAGEGVTIDCSLVELPADQQEAYIRDRIDELTSQDVGIPSPYTPEVTEREPDTEYPLEFREVNGQQYGVGYADPEYRIMLEDMGQLPRYRYVISWRYLEERDKLAEIEVYVPKDEFSFEKASLMVEQLRIEDG